MALVKCPDCGKMISSRAKQCPDCGCPAEFFVKEDINKKENKVIFHIAGYDVSYQDSEIQRKVATYLGAFIKAADMAYDEMVEKYESCKNIKEVLEKSKGSNIITFSNYVDEIIDSQLMNKILNLLDKKIYFIV
ncbi:hypothetical protein [uncultured Methanobrevibacter sp.]|mgnify:CR=1 FL=1|uniref:hypothetical protein n=1 Tax=uncultured Methanobrevibacter sp. TaxID=253161 RepID=UPI00262E6F55